MDFHCHLDLYPNAKQIYAEAARKVDFLWLVTTSPRAFYATSKVLPATEKLFISPGLHPEISDKKINELETLLAQIETCPGVGEIGLDGAQRYKQHRELQRFIFQSILQKSEALGGRILSIHSRAAARETLNLLEAYPGYGTAVLHWFTDSPSQLARAIELGCWFSIGPAMLRSANGRKLVKLMPEDRVVPESDGPFAKVGGVPVMPWEAPTVSTTLAELWNIPLKNASQVLRTNGLRLANLLQPGFACTSTGAGP